MAAASVKEKSTLQLNQTTFSDNCFQWFSHISIHLLCEFTSDVHLLHQTILQYSVHYSVNCLDLLLNCSSILLGQLFDSEIEDMK